MVEPGNPYIRHLVYMYISDCMPQTQQKSLLLEKGERTKADTTKSLQVSVQTIDINQ